jgi:PAS domain S-box-containing protein
MAVREIEVPLMTDRSTLRFLIIEDDPDTRANLQDILEMDDCHVATASTITEALARRDWRTFAAVILDRRLPDGTAEEFLPKLRQLAPTAAIVIVTGYADVEGAIAALRYGAVDYILKPVNPDVLRARLTQLGERWRLTLAKERSEAAFRTLVEAAPCMIVILRPDHSILYFSPFAEQLTGYRAKDVLGKDYLNIFIDDPAVREGITREIGRVLEGLPSLGFENPIRCKDGTRRHMAFNRQRLSDFEGGPAVLSVGQDVTSLIEAQQKALQAERLAAIGQMMTGLAHESGNALARSQACLEMLALEVPDRPEAIDLIDRIQKAQNHLQQLYEEVRNYAAPFKLEREIWDVALTWRQAWENLVVRRQGRDAVVQEECDRVNRECAIDPFRTEQVFRNILENSLAACHDPVRITIRCATVELAGRPALRIAFRDNGPGLNPEQSRRIFDPFYTTKTKGTGLGMAIAKRIVEAHGGQLAVGTTGFPGAEIVVILPREGI